MKKNTALPYALCVAGAIIAAFTCAVDPAKAFQAQAPAPPTPAVHARTIDFTVALIEIDGKPIQNSVPGAGPNDKPTVATFTLGDAVVQSLEQPMDEDKGMSGLDKFALDELAHKVYKGKAVSLSAEEIAKIKARIAKVFGPLVVGATWRLLDPSVVKDSK